MSNVQCGPNVTIQIKKYAIDYLITVGTLPANSEAIGKISILQMCSYPELCVVKKEEEDYSGTGYEDGQYPFVLLQPRGFAT